MKFLANENIPLATIRLLREQGHDVKSISEESAGITDREVLEIAADENRIVVTFDSDYGELVFFAGFPAPPSVLYLRFEPTSPEEPAEMIQSLLVSDETILAGYFVVLDRSTIRRRPLPTDEG